MNVAVIRRTTKRQVNDVSANDHLFSLDVRYFWWTNLLIANQNYVLLQCRSEILTSHCWFQVKLCNGKLVHVEACRKGFYCVGKQRILCHNLVDLLRQISRGFDNVSVANACYFLAQFVCNLMCLLSLCYLFDYIHICFSQS